MKQLLALITTITLFLPVSAFSQSDKTQKEETTMQQEKLSQLILRKGAKPSIQGSGDYFTGNVRIDPLFDVNDSMNVSGGLVTFEARARSAWHIHPAGQTLIVTSGIGWTQVWGGSIEEIHPGDVVTCPQGVKHWHGASPTTSMSHIAITGYLDDKNVEWLEKVSNEQYRK